MSTNSQKDNRNLAHEFTESEKLAKKLAGRKLGLCDIREEIARIKGFGSAAAFKSCAKKQPKQAPAADSNEVILNPDKNAGFFNVGVQAELCLFGADEGGENGVEPLNSAICLLANEWLQTAPVGAILTVRGSYDQLQEELGGGARSRIVDYCLTPGKKCYLRYHVVSDKIEETPPPLAPEQELASSHIKEREGVLLLDLTEVSSKQAKKFLIDAASRRFSEAAVVSALCVTMDQATLDDPQLNRCFTTNGKNMLLVQNGWEYLQADLEVPLTFAESFITNVTLDNCDKNRRTVTFTKNPGADHTATGSATASGRLSFTGGNCHLDLRGLCFEKNRLLIEHLAKAAATGFMDGGRTLTVMAPFELLDVDEGLWPLLSDEYGKRFASKNGWELLLVELELPRHHRHERITSGTYDRAAEKLVFQR